MVMSDGSVLRQRALGSATALPGRSEALALILACYVLSFGTFENIGNLGGAERFVPEHLRFDAIAAYKLATRLVAAYLVGGCLWRLRHSPRWSYVTACFLPLLLFGLWAMCTTLWSPMAPYTGGHALEFLLLVAIALAASLLGVRPEHARAFLKHACLIQMACLGLLVVLSILDPQNARIMRSPLETETVMFAAGAETNFIKNPSEIACIAALALVLMVNLRLLWGWRWTRWVFVPLVALAGWVLFVTQTRAILVSALLLVGLGVLYRGGRRLLAVSGLVVGASCLAYLMIDPSLDRLDPVREKVALYLSRGQSTEELRGLGGRLGNWTTVTHSLAEHPTAMIHGYGYSMATPSGRRNIEGVWRRYTGHNILLDVFSGTGVIGLTLFLWGFARLGSLALLGCRGRDGRLPFLALTSILFSFLTGVFGDSIVGPMDPSSVGVFLILGLGIWQMSVDGPSVDAGNTPKDVTWSERKNHPISASRQAVPVVLLIHEALPFHGGVTRKFLTLARRLPLGPYHFGCLTGGPESVLPALAGLGLPVVELGGRGWVTMVHGLRRYLIRHDIRLALTCSFRVYCALKLATLFLNCRVAFWLCDFSLLRKPVKRMLFHLISRGDWLLAGSANLLTAHARPGRRRVALLYNGVEPPPPADKAGARSRLGLPSDALILFYAADYQPYKDHATLLRAFRQLAERHENLYLVLCGRAGNLARDRDDPALLGAPWNSRVFIFGPRDDLHLFLAASDIYVHPCYEEGFGNAVVEAMLAGRPVVVADRGAMPEVVNGHGVHFRARDSDSLASAIDELLCDTARCTALGLSAQSWARDAYQPDRFARKFQEIAQWIMKGE